MSLSLKCLGSALCVLFVLATPSSALAYEVFLDYDTDSDPSTINNIAIGPTSVIVNIVIVFTPLEMAFPPAQVAFTLDWDCEGGGRRDLRE